MSDIRIIPVTTKKGLRTFIQFYYDLYEGSKYAVPYLRFDEWNTLSKGKNPAFDFCEAQYFLAIDYSIPKVVGRIAAIINHCANDQWNKKQVRFGWFDFIDNLEVSSKLLDAAAHWGRERGMEELVGPLGFTDMDREGMLIEGFHEKSTMYVNYNYPYYPKHMQALDLYQKDNDWLEYRIKVPEVTPPKFAKTAQLIESRYNLHVHKFTKHELVQGGMGREVFRIVNETYKDLYDFQQLTDRQIDGYVDSYIKMADMNLITGVVDGNDNNRLIGFGVSFPSMTEALQKNRNGKLFPWGWLRLLRVMKCHATDTWIWCSSACCRNTAARAPMPLSSPTSSSSTTATVSNGRRRCRRWRATRVCRASGSIWKACSTVAAAATEESYRNLKKNKNN